ncbi:MAG: EscT/YscT/HrcT family type III secretion system export apparatus protein [Chlamydiales bacterium]|nr:EscT/YscT/HrcT family type III secretion system export apparatus protein [Chlamydiia bacterium]MCP5505174.1 EscT/YscT/HrcT family type III secretion system export apparatus protein [Chlamydiales bacterium]
MLDYFSTLPNMTLWGVVSLFFLVLMRFGPILAMTPFLGAKLAPGIARMGLAVFLSIIFLPYLIVNVKEPIAFNNAFILYSLKEILIGFILGFFVTIPFYIVQTSGIIVDYLRGASIMQSQDPSLQTQASPIGIFYNYMLIVIFFQISGPFLFFDAMVKSYEVVPPAEFINPLFFSVKSTFWKTTMDIVNQIVAIAIQLSAPCIVAILMAEMFLGIANRLAPQVQIAFLGMSIKSLLGLALLWAAWFFILKQFTKQTYDWLDLIDRMIAFMKYMNASP